jgi:capsular exopolysaccharide synthesis family protein
MLKKLKKITDKYFTPPLIITSARSAEGIDTRLISFVGRHSLIAEQYKSLRTNLYYLSPDKPMKAILITSSQEKEGKSVTASNLAFTLSLDSSKKTILVDADLRKPTIHTLFSMPREPGFCDILLDKAGVGRFTQKPAVENLYIIPSGMETPIPSEILASKKVKEIIENLKTQFDYIIFDSPPVLSVTDASILGANCDGVILVVKAEATQKNIIEEASNTLQEDQAKIKGCILTNFHVPVTDYALARHKHSEYITGK